MSLSLRATGLVAAAVAIATLVPTVSADAAGAAAPRTTKAAAAMAKRYVTDIGTRNYGDMWTILAPAQKHKVTEIQLIECESTVLAPIVQTYTWTKLAGTARSSAAIPLVGRKPIVKVTGYVTLKTTTSKVTYRNVKTNPPINAVYLSGAWHWYLDSAGLAACESE